ncbi:MAG: hypothetical protein WBM44_22795 [Waterburya sp.]
MSSIDATPRPRERLTAKLPVEVIERARNAVYWSPGLTLASLTEDALSAYIDALEAERGEVFPQRQGELKLGRPIKL